MLLIILYTGLLIANIVMCASGYAASWVMVFVGIGGLLLATIIDFMDNIIFIDEDDLEEYDALSSFAIRLLEKMDDDDLLKMKDQLLEKYRNDPIAKATLNDLFDQAEERKAAKDKENKDE